MRVLVIGGTRFMGPFVVRRLVASGHEVTVFHRGRSEADLPREVGHVHGDRRVWSESAAELRRLGPDVVLDMIALSEGDAQRVVDTFRGVAGRIVVASSLDVYRAYGRLLGTEPGPPDAVPLAEDAPLRERLFPLRDAHPAMGDYEKILVERAVMGAAEPSGTVLRLPFVYGPCDGQHRLFPYLKRMDDGRTHILVGEGEARWRGSRGYVEDVAAAVALAVTEGAAAGRVYNVGQVEALPTAAWIEAIGRCAGWTGRVVTVPAADLPPHLAAGGTADHDLVADTSRIRGELGYAEAVDFAEGLARTVAWERENPPARVEAAQFDYGAEDEALARLGALRATKPTCHGGKRRRP